MAEALRCFTEYGATAWAARALAELDRMRVRPPAPSELTTIEGRIAGLAASGLTNRVIAGQLFLSVKTVEANLGRVYRKLGIGSRAELGVRLTPPAE